MSSKGIKYLEIAEDLSKRIKAESFSLGRLPSERELAVEYDVNRITLRKALNLLEQNRIISRHGRQGTLVSKGNNDVSGSTIVYLLVNRAQLDHFHSRTLFWLEKEAKIRGLKVIFSSISSTDDVKEFIKLYGNDKNIGGIVLSGLVTGNIAKKVKKLNIPIVLVGGLTYADPVQKEFHRVYLDSMDYSFEAVSRFIAKGHRKIALLNGPSYKYYLDIYQGYIKAFDIAGLKYNEKFIVRCADESFDEVFKVTEELLRKYKPTAFFVANERMAEAVARAVKVKRGKPITAEAIITAGGNQELARNLGYSMVFIDNQQIAAKAIEIIDKVKGVNLAEKLEYRLKYKIIGSENLTD